MYEFTMPQYYDPTEYKVKGFKGIKENPLLILDIYIP